MSAKSRSYTFLGSRPAILLKAGLMEDASYILTLNPYYDPNRRLCSPALFHAKSIEQWGVLLVRTEVLSKMQEM